MIWLVILACAGLLIAAYLDVNSTLQFLKRGTAVEVGYLSLFGLMAWLQRTFPTSWPYTKIGLTLMLAVAALLLFPLKWALAVIVMLAVLYLIEALSNYQLSK